MVISDHELVRFIVADVALGVQDDRRQETILVLAVHVEGVFVDVLDPHVVLLLVLVLDHDELTHWHVIHSVVVTHGPGVQVGVSAGAILQILKENFNDSNRASSIQTQIARWLQELLLVLLNKRGVENTLFEDWVFENTAQELDVR